MRFRRAFSLLWQFMFKSPVVEQTYLQRTEAFLSDMRMQTNPRDLYRWARDQIREANGQRMELTYIPGFVGWSSSRMPTGGYVEPNDGVPYAHLIWDKGGNRWGLKVGPPEFTPAADPHDHHLEWAPGVYAWHEVEPNDQTP
jgi:hypothetical protein